MRTAGGRPHETVTTAKRVIPRRGIVALARRSSPITACRNENDTFGRNLYVERRHRIPFPHTGARPHTASHQLVPVPIRRCRKRIRRTVPPTSRAVSSIDSGFGPQHLKFLYRRRSPRSLNPPLIGNIGTNVTYTRRGIISFARRPGSTPRIGFEMVGPHRIAAVAIGNIRRRLHSSAAERPGPGRASGVF